MTAWVSNLPLPVNLRRLFPQASYVGCVDIHVTSATDRSRDCQPQGLFAAIRGTSQDGCQFIAEALQHGAAALLVDRPLADVTVPQCVVPDVRRAYAQLCSALMADPSRRLGVAGVTGTNGKTTTTWLIRSILQGADRQTGLLGTIDYCDGQRTEPSRLTTPDSSTLARWLAAMIANGATHATLELSSHALDQRRSAGVALDAAIITNITQDHFDYHHDFEAYRLSKLRILDHLKENGTAIINVDDPGSLSCLPHAPGKVLTFGLGQPADFTAHLLESNLRGTLFRLMHGEESVLVRTPLIGRYNVSNCLAAAAAAWHLGIGLQEISRGIEALHCVPGRMEPVVGGQPFPVFVDYAHTEDALRNAITALRPLTRGRILCVFGAGGDRDRTKRPLLGRAAAEADLAVVTSDNPRSEDPQRIIEEIVAGMAGRGRSPYIEPDRERAIRWALQHAGAGDTVLIAGKGHETEQQTGSVRLHFDDREVARACLDDRYPAHAGPHPHLIPHNSLVV
ncbi:MAG: UDP-N-acetylmuramoyl-L-alanyl-D-glutamate--2,6-diaminopimelate ligase [Planctomycetales bacterium]